MIGLHTKEEKLAAFERLLDIQERLRKECPWDRKQTFESLRPNTIEETFELADALMKHDKRNICKELGDVMEHVVFYALLGSETNDFDIADVCNAQSDKLMFRHDFIDWTGWAVANDNMAINKQGQVVYKDELNTESQAATSANGNVPSTATQVELTWEQRKQKEREGNKTVLSGVPDSLPSLIKAYRIQDKARNVGFDWEKKEDVWEKVTEEPNANNADSLNAGDTTIYGTMLDGGMNSIVLLTDRGDTLEIIQNPEDTTEVVKGGKLIGDRFAVIAYKEYGDMMLRSAINITSLLGNWTSLDKNFEIKEGGEVTSNLQSEKNVWTSWKIYNGKLLLSRDTFDVIELGADTMSLENKTGIFVFGRKK